MGFVQYGYETPEQREVQRREKAFQDTIKDMENHMSCLISNLQILRRNGPSKDLLQRIDDGGFEFTTRLKAIMDEAMSAPLRLSGPNKGNRYA